MDFCFDAAGFGNWVPLVGASVSSKVVCAAAVDFVVELVVVVGGKDCSEIKTFNTAN